MTAASQVDVARPIIGPPVDRLNKKDVRSILARVIDARPALPESVRAAVLVRVKAADRAREGRD